MKKDILNLSTSSFPTTSGGYDALDIVGNTVGRYFDYKRETQVIEYETQKLKENTQVILSEIDSRLELSLDENSKNFKKEMYRLSTIAKELKQGLRNQKNIFKHIRELTNMLSRSDISLESKEQIPKLIAMAHQQLNDEAQRSMQKLDLMSSFESNQKLIGGE